MKKIINILLIALLIIQYVPVLGASYDQPVKLMEQLGIMTGYEDGELHPENEVSRAEFITMLMRAYGMDDASFVGQETAFIDVPIEHWASGYIKMGNDMGIIDGYDGQYFGPSDGVTFYQAVKMIVALLGYSVVAEERGGYPQGYLNCAVSVDILDGISVDERILTRGEFAVLIANSLEAALMEPNYIEGKDIYSKTGETLLQRLDIDIIIGFVDGVYGISLNSNVKINQNQVSINNELYDTTFDNASLYFATQIKAYVRRNDSGRDTILYMVGSNGMDSIVVNAQDIVTSETDYTRITYFDGKRQKSEDIAGMRIIKNGNSLTTAQLPYAFADFESGTATICDTDNDNNFDTVIIWSYDTVVVNSVYDYTIYGKYGKTVDTKNCDTVKIDKKGEYVELSDLESNDVLWVALSPNGSLASIIVSDKEPVTGTLESISNSGLEAYCIDGTEYIVSSGYLTAAANNADGYRKISIGDYAVFYLDMEGRIAAAEHSKKDSEGSLTNAGLRDFYYGYLIKAGTNEGTMGDGYVRLLTEANRFENIMLSKNKNISYGRLVSGAYVKTSMSAENVVTALNISGKQLVAYKLDSNGHIKEINVAGTAGDLDNFSLDVNSGYRYYSNGIFDQHYITDENTVVFRIPNAGLYEEDFSVTQAQSQFSNGSRYPVAFYDVNNMYVGAVVVTDKLTRYVDADDGKEIYVDRVNSPVMLIEKVYSKMTDEGESYTIVEGYEGDGKKSVYISDALASSSTARADLRAGNIIQYETNASVIKRALYSEDEKVMVVYQKIFDCDDEAAVPFQKWDHSDTLMPNAPIGTTYGSVVRYRMPQLILANGRTDIGGEAPFVISDGAVVYRYNRVTNKIELMRHEDIAVGQNIFIWSRYNNTRMVIIIE